MSRIGKQPIIIPDGVTVTETDGIVVVKGPKGELSFTMPREAKVTITDKEVVVEKANNSRQAQSMWGTVRSVISNKVTGVSEGFEKKLEIHGVGYRASVKGKDLELVVGYSHPVLVKAPENITFTVEKEVVTVAGIDNVVVGQIASNIRKVRKPEPYKGKGIRYQNERIRRKVGKVVGAAA